MQPQLHWHKSVMFVCAQFLCKLEVYSIDQNKNANLSIWRQSRRYFASLPIYSIAQLCSHFNLLYTKYQIVIKNICIRRIWSVLSGMFNNWFAQMRKKIAYACVRVSKNVLFRWKLMWDKLIASTKFKRKQICACGGMTHAYTATTALTVVDLRDLIALKFADFVISI